MIAAYIRVSSKAQNFNTQHHAILKAAAAQGVQIDEVFSEKKSATKSLSRPELDRLRALIRAGKVSRLYVFKIDRLTRTGIRDTFEVVDECKKHGCALVTVADDFSFDGPMGEVVLALIAWAAKMETLNRAERVAAARERFDAEGRHWGRPRRMAEADVERAAELHAAGASLRELAQRFGVPRGTLAEALKRLERVRAERAPAEPVEPTPAP